jgi:hypothetical protein
LLSQTSIFLAVIPIALILLTVNLFATISLSTSRHLERLPSHSNKVAFVYASGKLDSSGSISS